MVAEGVGVTTNVFEAVAVPQLAPDVFKVSVTEPEKLEGGVYVAFKAVELGENTPPVTFEDHVPPVAVPPTLPPKAAEVPP